MCLGRSYLHILAVLLVLAVSFPVVSSLPTTSVAWAAQLEAPTSDAKCVCGPKRVTVLLVDFADVTHGSSSTPEYYSGIVRAMNASFYRQSYEKMWVVGGEVYGWYKTTFRLSDLRVTTWQLDWNDAGKLENIAKNKASELHVSGIVFGVFAGPVWAWATGHPSTLTVVGEKHGYNLLRSFMHEFGHNLGLPDLYNYENLKAEPVGEWDLMDSGREELSAYSRLKLGWLPRDSVTTIDSRRDLAVLVNSLDSPNGMRALKVQLYASNSYYLVETRRKTDGLHLVVYYIKGVIESGKGSIVIEAVRASDNPVFVGNRIDCALIVLDAQPDGLKVELAREAQGKKAREAFDAVRFASALTVSAWGSDRVQGLDEAKQELDRAWQSFHVGDFDGAKNFADKAGELAKAARVPESYSRFQELRPNVQTQLQNASAFKSDEAIQYIELAKKLLRNADGNFTKKEFDAALDNLLEANRTLTKADEAERAFVESQQVTKTETQPIPVLVVVIASVVAIFVIVGLWGMTRRKPIAR